MLLINTWQAMDVERVNYRRQHSGGRRTGADQVVLRQRRASEGSKIATDWRMSVNVEVNGGCSSAAAVCGGVAVCVCVCVCVCDLLWLCV